MQEVPEIPALLLRLIEAGRWRHPGDEALRSIVPFVHDPLEFLCSVERIHAQSASIRSRSLEELGIVNSGNAKSGDPLLLNADCALFIAINRQPGDDVAIALDFRTNPTEPRVVASAWEPGCCVWREVAPSFSQFASLVTSAA